jgi:hypothetical protein
MRALSALVVSLVSSSAFLSGAAKAEDAALFQCINRFKAVGVSPDAALAECKQQTLAECVKRLVGQNFVATAIRKGPEGYLIDLGNNDSRWMEGGPWKAKGCVPYLGGPKRRQQAMTSWGFDSVNQWFRQGWCPNETLELNQSYGLEEAKLRCELGDMIPDTKKEP